MTNNEEVLTQQRDRYEAALHGVLSTLTETFRRPNVTSDEVLDAVAKVILQAQTALKDRK